MAAKGKPFTTTDDDAPTNNRGEHLSLNGHGNGGWRVDPPGQVDNPHSHRPDMPPGHAEAEAAGETQSGTDDAETLAGTDGGDSLSGAGGDDSLVGAAGADTMDGGDGADTFGADSIDSLDRIAGFTAGEDKLAFTNGAAATGANYVEDTAADYDAALVAAQTAIAGGAAYVAIEITTPDGTDVIVFADTDGDPTTVDAAVALAGATLAGVSEADFA
jgi:Ca2+-binding RTX toxin-like protein